MERSTDSTVSRRRRSESIPHGGCNGSSGGSYATPDPAMMLRFRPIAPKPVTGVETVAVDGSDVTGMKNFVLSDKRRPKRKYDKTRSRSSTAAKKKKKGEEEEEEKRNYLSDQTDRQLTAGETLCPVHVSRKRDDPSIFNTINNIEKNIIDTKIGHLPPYFHKFLHTGSSTGTDSALRSLSVTPEQFLRHPECSDDVNGPYGLSLFKIPDAADRVACRAVESCSRVVVVETVLNNISNGVEVDALELGRTDSEKMKTLEGDTLPGFVSDSSNNVIWVNRVFEAMICGGGSKETAVNDYAPELVVCDLPQTWRAFSCQVKLRRHGKLIGGGEKYDTVPCDVWRMESGGFAWRLDVKTALSLGGCYSRS